MNEQTVTISTDELARIVRDAVADALGKSDRVPLGRTWIKETVDLESDEPARLFAELFAAAAGIEVENEGRRLNFGINRNGKPYARWGKGVDSEFVDYEYADLGFKAIDLRW